ncbi:MAG: FAD-dependent oxidoreductase [Lachnospiraceae bacterium]|jgi:hypothetical protein|nr:FAD-dependent oxidoreductase [Lachnospiraceae bacterium]
MELMKKNIVVVGGGPGGLAAAVTAAREGKKVLLVERNGYLGGQLGSGLPFLAFWDKKRRQVIGGFAQEFVDRLQEEGASFGHAYCPHHLSTTLIDPFYSRILCFQMVKEAGVELLLHSELSGVHVEDGRIRSVVISGKGQNIEVEADIFIDATGDGDLASMSGAECEKGDSESHVMQPPTLMFNLAGIHFDRFYDFIEAHPEELPYDVLSNIEEGYNADFLRENRSFIFLGMHHLLEELRKKGECPVDRETVIFIRQPNPGEIAVNTIRLLNFDGSDIHDLSNGEMEAHLQIPKLIKMFKENVPGFENCYLSSINASIGVRESRRVMGIKKLNHEDAVAGKRPEDTVALCSYFIDVHNGAGRGTYRVSIEEPFGIPYGCLVSKDIPNLMMAGRDISTDHLAFGATRIMNVCMAVGQAAGLAASMSIDGKQNPEQVDTDELRKKLLEQNAILEV